MERGRGRPLKLTPEIQEKLTNIIAGGHYYSTACGYVGIDYTTFNNWMNAGEKSKSGIYFDFFHAIKKAEAASIIKFMEKIKDAIPDNWQAAAWIMERRWREMYSLNIRNTVEHSGEIKIVVSKTLEEI